MPRPLLSGAALVLVLACRPSAPEAHRPARAAPAVTSSQEEPDTTPPADVSHGEAPIGGPAAEPAPRLARLEPAERTRLHRVRLEMKHAPVVIAPGVTYAAWTFGGRVPGPVLHVRQGDTVDFTLVNRANIPHSMDFHAAEIAPSKYYMNVMPGDSLHYRFVARVPGAFMYHCGPRRWRCTSPTGCTARWWWIRPRHGPGRQNSCWCRASSTSAQAGPEGATGSTGRSSWAWRPTTSSSTAAPPSTRATRSTSGPTSWSGSIW